MDLTSIFLLCLMSCIIGAVLMLLVQYYAIVKYFDVPEVTEEQRSINEQYMLPDAVMASLRSPDPDTKNPIIAFNLIFQFLFFELRNASKVRKWFYRKLTLELDELISKTTIGKFFDKLSIRDLDLGAQFPEIKNIRVHNADLHETEGHIESLDLVVDLHYSGNFKISIDADMVLGKKGFLAVKVKNISGLARLQFTRKPYTHWSLCFLGDPQLDLDIETVFQGRQMQSNVTSLISNQIRKAIRRKHTLPNYKLRYKPFFHKTEEDTDATDIDFDGSLEVNISELSRLMVAGSTGATRVFATLTLAPMPWVLARQHDDKHIIVSLDLEIRKAKNQQIGIVFKQTEHGVIVEAIIPNTPATKAKMRQGDVLVAIEGRKVSHINHISKIIKSLNKSVFTLRIERSIAGSIRNDQVLEDYDVYEDFSEFNISFSKNTDSVQIGTKMLRKNSIDRPASSDSSRSNTPTSSPRRQEEGATGVTMSASASATTGLLSRTKTKNLSRCNSEVKAVASSSGDDASIKSIYACKSFANKEDAMPVECYQQHSTIECDIGSLIKMNDLAHFNLTESAGWLNLNVFGRNNDDVELLGYLNVAVGHVLVECADSNLGQFVKQYPLTPPTAPNLSNHMLSSLSGFDPNRCFGDALLSFVWTGNLTSTITPTDSAKKSKAAKDKTVDDERNDPANVSKQHDFVRTHFQRSTQCDFCGKKIWLKDAVQCKDCAMCCHKKCVNKCQNSTVCGPVDGTTTTTPAVTMNGSQSSMPSVEFKVTEAETDTEYLDDIDEQRPKLDQHRQSFSELISQGLKRVNSANNLAIPGIVSAMNQASRSLPPSPQHTPRKQSLVNQSANPFVAVTQKLELLPDDITEIAEDQIVAVTEELIGWGTPEELMGLAKTTSRGLYADLEPDDRVEKINILLSKIRLALDIETTLHANLTSSTGDLTKIVDRTPSASPAHNAIDTVRPTSDTSLLLQTKAPNTTQSSASPTTFLSDATKKSKESAHDVARKAFLISQSEERVQALSAIMLHLCTGLQYAQGVATQ